MRLLLDIDGVCANYVDAMILQFGLQDRFTADDIKCWDTAEALGLPPSAYDTIKRAVVEENFCARIKPYPQAREFVARLQEKHEVIGCTTPMSATWLQQRSLWMELVLGISLENQVHRHQKQFERGDLLIDDSTENCTRFGAYNDGMLRPAHLFPKAFLFAQPWNAEKDVALHNAPSVRRVANYSEVLSLLGCRQI